MSTNISDISSIASSVPKPPMISHVWQASPPLAEKRRQNFFVSEVLAPRFGLFGGTGNFFAKFHKYISRMKYDKPVVTLTPYY